MSRIATRSLAHLEPVELLGEIYPQTTFGDRVCWLLCLAELQRTGQLPSIDVLAERMRRAGVTGRYHKRGVQRMLARLYACGAITPGSFRYAAHVSLEERVFAVFPIMRLLEQRDEAAGVNFWLPPMIAKFAAMFQTHPGSTPLRFGGSADELNPTVVGSLRPDAVGDGETRLPGFYIRTGEFDELADDVPPWGSGGVPLTARGSILTDSNGHPLV